jgi:aminoglycoside 6'-N-acetyltransferase I
VSDSFFEGALHGGLEALRSQGLRRPRDELAIQPFLGPFALNPYPDGVARATVRLLESTDASEHLRMRKALWPGADVAELAAEREAMLTDPDQVVFVAPRADGGLFGFVEAGVRPFANGVDEHPCAFVEGWWVDLDARRGGVGRALIEAVEQWARARGFTELGSDAELDNLLSHRAHQALGFEERERVVHFRKRLS